MPDEMDDGKITRLSVVGKVKASETARLQAIALLRDALAMAEAGDITEVILIVDHPDNTWGQSMTSTTAFTAAIGRLEMVKHLWIEQFLVAARGKGEGRPLG